MLRLIAVALLLVVLVYLVRGMVREMKAKRRPQAVKGAHDHMIQDPVCLVYVPRDAAVATQVGENRYYFCSRECAEAFERKTAE